MTGIAVHIAESSFFSTHHATPGDALTDRERPFTAPAFSLLVGRARRFTSLVTQMHIEVCGALQSELATTAVFATCHGEIQTAETLLADFHANSMVSSARFALSVHNSPSGVFSVATGRTAPTTTVTGGNAVAAGWLEAALTALDGGKPVLLSIADEPVPAIFQGPTTAIGVAAAFVLAPSGAGRRAELAIVETATEAEDTLHVLARVADAARGTTPIAITLGRLTTTRPTAHLELRLS